MSSSYYFHYDICGCCKRHDTVLLGVAEPGRRFLWAAYVDGFISGSPTVTTRTDWVTLLTKMPGRIADSSGKALHLEDLLNLVEERQPLQATEDFDSYLDGEGYNFARRRSE